MSEEETPQFGSPVSVASRLYQCLMFDVWPTAAAVTDFGIDSPDHYAALQWVTHEGLITEAQLQDACGNGELLTRLVNVQGNPYRNVTFHTFWDDVRLLDSKAEL